MFKDVDLMTAIITPFDQAQKIDYPALKKLTEHLLTTGTKGFVIGGTTGETPTLTENEKLELYRKFVEIVDGRVPIIAGAGSNNTQQTIDFINKLAQISGIDMALVVVPYYNKPNQRGMKAHFETIAKNSPLPIMIYNILISKESNNVIRWKIWNILLNILQLISTFTVVRMPKLYLQKLLVLTELFR